MCVCACICVGVGEGKGLVLNIQTLILGTGSLIGLNPYSVESNTYYLWIDSVQELLAGGEAPLSPC